MSGTRVPIVLVVEDDRDLNANFCTWLGVSGYQVLSALNAVEAMSVLRNRTVDVVLCDLRLPGLDGIELINLINELSREIQVIVVSGQGTMHDVIDALREGKAFDFLVKPVLDLKTLNRTIERALLQRSNLSRVVSPTSPPPSSLSTRELELLRFLSLGLDNRQISRNLFLSEGTVRNQLSRLYQKLQVDNRMQAALAYHAVMAAQRDAQP